MAHIGRMEQLIAEGTNAERIMNGLSALVWDEQLARIARGHSQDMAEQDFFSHRNLEGEGPGERARRKGFTRRKCIDKKRYVEAIRDEHNRIIGERCVTHMTLSGVGENIGKMPYGNVRGVGYVENTSPSVAAALVRSWMRSPGHRKNVLMPAYTHLGVGVAFDGRYYVATQNFW